MNILKTIRKQPESIKNLILCVVIIVLSVSLLIWWTTKAKQTLKRFQQEGLTNTGIKLPSFEQELQDVSDLKIEKLEEVIKAVEEETADQK